MLSVDENRSWIYISRDLFLFRVLRIILLKIYKLIRYYNMLPKLDRLNKKENYPNEENYKNATNILKLKLIRQFL